MADGEIEVNVSADGVDEAAEEFTGEMGEGSMTGGDGDDGSGLGDAIGGGIVGGLVASLLGPLLDTLTPLTQIAQAFLAPVSAMLLRLLTPVLRSLIQLLPVWLDFLDAVEPYLEPLAALLTDLSTAFMDGVDFLAEELSTQSLLDRVITILGGLLGGVAGAKLGALVGGIVGGFLGSVVPGLGTAIGAKVGAIVGGAVGSIVGGITGGVTVAKLLSGIRNVIDRLRGALENIPGVSDIPGAGAQIGADDIADRLGFGGGSSTNIEITGGLEEFVDGVRRDGRVEL